MPGDSPPVGTPACGSFVSAGVLVWSLVHQGHSFQVLLLVSIVNSPHPLLHMVQSHDCLALLLFWV